MTAPARIGLVGAALLGLNLLVAVPSAHAAPPEREPHVFTCSEDTPTDSATAASSDDEVGTHPSGKEGKGLTESGNSGTQGKSDSDPDGTYNGGSDKPGCEGGYAVDGEYDRDGNNGCGNDADFEDDNNGNCGGKKNRPADDCPVAPFGMPEDDDVDEPVPAPVVEEPAPVVEKPAPVVEEPDPVVEEEPEGPIVWADEDPVNDPDPDYEYGDDDVPVLAEEPAATDAPDMDLAAHRDLARTGGLLAAAGLAAAGALFGSGRLVLAYARRRLMS